MERPKRRSVAGFEANAPRRKSSTMRHATSLSLGPVSETSGDDEGQRRHRDSTVGRDSMVGDKRRSRQMSQASIQAAIASSKSSVAKMRMTYREAREMLSKKAEERQALGVEPVARKPAAVMKEAFTVVHEGIKRAHRAEHIIEVFRIESKGKAEELDEEDLVDRNWRELLGGKTLFEAVEEMEEDVRRTKQKRVSAVRAQLRSKCKLAQRAIRKVIVLGRLGGDSMSPRSRACAEQDAAEKVHAILDDVEQMQQEVRETKPKGGAWQAVRKRLELGSHILNALSALERTVIASPQELAALAKSLQIVGEEEEGEQSSIDSPRAETMETIDSLLDESSPPGSPRGFGKGQGPRPSLQEKEVEPVKAVAPAAPPVQQAQPEVAVHKLPSVGPGRASANRSARPALEVWCGENDGWPELSGDSEPQKFPHVSRLNRDLPLETDWCLWTVETVCEERRLQAEGARSLLPAPRVDVSRPTSTPRCHIPFGGRITMQSGVQALVTLESPLASARSPKSQRWLQPASASQSVELLSPRAATALPSPRAALPSPRTAPVTPRRTSQRPPPLLQGPEAQGQQRPTTTAGRVSFGQVTPQSFSPFAVERKSPGALSDQEWAFSGAGDVTKRWGGVFERSAAL